MLGYYFDSNLLETAFVVSLDLWYDIAVSMNETVVLTNTIEAFETIDPAHSKWLVYSTQSFLVVLAEAKDICKTQDVVHDESLGRHFISLSINTFFSDKASLTRC